MFSLVYVYFYVYICVFVYLYVCIFVFVYKYTKFVGREWMRGDHQLYRVCDVLQADISTLDLRPSVINLQMLVISNL